MKVLALSIALFAAACLLPALEFQESHGTDIQWGANILAVGWSGIFAGVLAWYANPFWVLGLVLGLRGKPKPAAIAGLVALAIGCSTFTLFGKVLPADEGNVNHMTLVRTLAGCYCWLASLATLPLVAIFPKYR